MSKNFLSSLPSPGELMNVKNGPEDALFEANGHIHTPYSFSAFSNLEEIFRMATREKISVLGINDFYVTDGYDAFREGCTDSGIFPLFNIEFIGLMQDEQRKGVRINDPNNPGRIYFCGKGLDYPFHISSENSEILERVKEETQNQLRAMVEKLNDLIRNVNPLLSLSFNEIKKRYAMELVRERHIAKALRFLAAESYRTPGEQLGFIESVYGNRRSKAGITDNAALENEIRSVLLKAGGPAFVEEDEKSFLDIKRIIMIIKDAGGIPCYPVLLDDPSGNYTEFEKDPRELYSALQKLGVGCIELIPGRNDHDILEKFVDFFVEKGFIVTFGTEHNTPEMIPLTITARGGRLLSTRLKQINSRGVCAIAAHQYFRAHDGKGYIDDDGNPRVNDLKEFESTGRKVIEYYLRRKYYDTGNIGTA